MTRMTRRERLAADREEYARIIAEQTGTTTPKVVGQAGWTEGPRKPKRVHTRRRASKVTITSPDGTQRTERALTAAEVQVRVNAFRRRKS